MRYHGVSAIVFSIYRAMEVWGSMEALERERRRRKSEMEEGERYRKGNFDSD